MTDKKFTDEEIIKAIGNLFKNTDGLYEVTIQNSTKGVYGEKQYYCIPEGVYNLIMRQSGFIDRQKTEIERLNKKVEDLAATQKTTKSTSGGSEMMKIYFETHMKELPRTCLDCDCQWCRKPCKKGVYDYILKKKYTKQRHENCPLKEIF